MITILFLATSRKVKESCFCMLWFFGRVGREEGNDALTMASWWSLYVKINTPWPWPWPCFIGDWDDYSHYLCLCMPTWTNHSAKHNVKLHNTDLCAYPAKHRMTLSRHLWHACRSALVAGLVNKGHMDDFKRSTPRTVVLVNRPSYVKRHITNFNEVLNMMKKTYNKLQWGTEHDEKDI